jgi:hypothetical protein
MSIATATHTVEGPTHPSSKSEISFKSISTQDSKIHERMDKKLSGPILASPKEFEHYPSYFD